LVIFAADSGRGSQRLVDAHEIGVHRKERDGMSMVFDFLQKGIREPGKSAGMHPDTQVAAITATFDDYAIASVGAHYPECGAFDRG
jgi:hypothetical protein